MIDPDEYTNQSVLYRPAPAPVQQPPILNTTTAYNSPNLVQQLTAGQRAGYQTGLANNAFLTANTQAEYDLNKGYLNQQHQTDMSRLGIKDSDIEIQRRALARQRPLMGTMADLQRLEYDSREAALQRQMLGLSQQRTLEQQLWGLERQELGSEREQDVYAAMRAKQKAESEAVVRGALESVGHGRNLEDIAKQLAWELADIDRRTGAQDVKESRYHLNYDEQRAQLSDAYNQINKVDRWKYYHQYNEELEKLNDQDRQLDNLATENGLTRQELDQKLTYSLQKLGLDRTVSLQDLAYARAQLAAGQFNPLQDLFGDIAQIGGLNLAPSGNYSNVGGYEVDSSYAPRFEYVASQFGLTPSSGLRSAEHNAEVGGVPNSAHLTGRAMDYTGSHDQMEAARQWALSNGASEALIHDAGSGMHLHVSW